MVVIRALNISSISNFEHIHNTDRHKMPQSNNRRPHTYTRWREMEIFAACHAIPCIPNAAFDDDLPLDVKNWLVRAKASFCSSFSIFFRLFFFSSFICVDFNLCNGNLIILICSVSFQARASYYGYHISSSLGWNNKPLGDGTTMRPCNILYNVLYWARVGASDGCTRNIGITPTHTRPDCVINNKFNNSWLLNHVKPNGIHRTFFKQRPATDWPSN